MGKLIVNNFVTLERLYEGKDRNIHPLHDDYHKDYHGDASFDFYHAERLDTRTWEVSGNVLACYQVNQNKAWFETSFLLAEST